MEVINITIEDYTSEKVINHYSDPILAVTDIIKKIEKYDHLEVYEYEESAGEEVIVLANTIKKNKTILDRKHFYSCYNTGNVEKIPFIIEIFNFLKYNTEGEDDKPLYNIEINLTIRK